MLGAGAKREKREKKVKETPKEPEKELVPEPQSLSIPDSTDFAVFTPGDKSQQILTWILEGNPDHHIKKAFEQYWPGEDIAPHVTAAMDQLYKAPQVDLEELDGWVLLSLKMLYAKAYAIGDFANAKSILKEIRAVAYSAHRDEDE